MHKLIVLSLDALGDTDAVHFEKMPGFRRLIEEGAYVKRMRSVFPTLTYPCHASIITGRYPKDTGIINNLLLQPSKENMDWYWYEKDIQGDTLFRAAKRRERNTAAFLWPVSANGNIDYNIAEIIPHRPWHTQAMVSGLNSNLPLLLELDQKYGHLRKGLQQPNLDDFTEACMHHVLEKHDPDLTMTHFIAVDDYKHRFGANAPEVVEAITSYDARIQKALHFIEHFGRGQTSLVVLSDHSHIDLTTGLRLNKFFLDRGLLTVNPKGIVQKYEVIMHEAGGSCYIYAKNQSPRAMTKLRDLLEEFAAQTGGIRSILTAKEAEVRGTDPDCTFLLDAKDGYYFIQDVNGGIIEETDHKYAANHGYDPDRTGYSAVFFGYGPAFRPTSLEDARLIDIAPTLSRIMDLRLRGAAGRVMEEILRPEVMQ